MSGKSPKEIEEFAYEFGNHCREFNTHEYYKKFIEDLMKDLTKDFSQAQIRELQQYIEKIAAARAKQAKDNADDSANAKNNSSEDQNSDSDDFM